MSQNSHGKETDSDHEDSKIEENAVIVTSPERKTPVDIRSPPTLKKIKSILSSGNLMNLDGSPPSSDKISKNLVLRFSSTAYVNLIPTRLELSPFSHDMFWQTQDCDSFKRSAVAELREFAMKHGCTGKQAISRLYQPTNDDRDTLEEVIMEIRRTVSRNSLSSMCLSESKDEPKDFSFLTSAKTDVEMNEEGLKSSNEKEQGQIWMVNWKKSEPAKAEISSESRNSFSFLVVDSDETSRRMIRILLEKRLGHSVQEACDGEMAVEAVRFSLSSNAPFDVIFMECCMPVMDGPTAAREMVRLGYEGRIFGFTDWSQVDNQMFLSSGASKILIKPLQPRDVAKIVTGSSYYRSLANRFQPFFGPAQKYCNVSIF